MNVRTLLVVGLSLVFGLSTAFGVSRMIRSAPQLTLEVAPIVVAAVEIPRGTVVTASMLTTTEWPKDRLPEGVMTEVDDALGRTVVIPLLKGEPLLDQKVAKSAFGRGVAPLVVRGMRAFTVMTPTLTSGVGGLILPGNKVDVLWTATSTGIKDAADDASGGGATVTLLQNIEILAADQQIGATDDKTHKELRSVTLQVTEADAKKLSLAQQKGTINLALRNGGDGENIDSPVVTLNDIRYAQGGRPREAVPEAAYEPAPRQPAARQAVRVRIRTLHGRIPGQVLMELYGKAEVPEPLPPPPPEPAKEASVVEL